MEIKRVFSGILKDLRIRNSFSAEEVAEKSGISVRHLRYLEKGTYQPSLETFFKVIEAAGGDPEEIFKQVSDRLKDR